MRKDTILMVLGVAVVAAGTYYILDFSIERKEPSLAPVTPSNPPVVDEKKAAQAPQWKTRTQPGPVENEGSKQSDNKQSRTESQTAGGTTTPAKNGSASAQGQGESNMQAGTKTAGGDQAKQAESGAGSDSTTAAGTTTGQSNDQTQSAMQEQSAESGGGQQQAAGGNSNGNAGTAGSSNTGGADKSESGEQKLIATATINVRAGAGKENDVVGQLQPQQEVRVKETDGDWIRIESGDVTGWAYRPLFKKP